MTATLVRKLLRDVRTSLIAVAFLLAAFQCLWAKITERILGQLAPFFHALAGLGGLTDKDVQNVLFEGPGKIIRTIIGGENIDLNGAMDMLSIGYVHPLVQTIFCIWAVGRASGAIAGETDRGTMELLLAQPMARGRLIFAHLCVDLIVIPLLCLSLWAGTCVGVWLTGPIKLQEVKLPIKQTRPNIEMHIGPVKLGFRATEKYELRFGPMKFSLPALSTLPELPRTPEAEERVQKRLEVRPLDFARAMPVAAALMFAISGYTLWLSARGRFRWRVLGIAVMVTLLMFLVNVIAQMWDAVRVLRPLTIFYYYQPQQAILDQGWNVNLKEWNGGQPLAAVPMLAVLVVVGIVGYVMAWRVFTRRDIPAPL